MAPQVVRPTNQAETRRNINMLSMSIGRQLETFRHKGLFSRAYSYPQGIELDGQEKKEKILLIFRSHPITIFPRVLITVFFFVSSVLVYFFAGVAGLGIGTQIVAVSLLLLLVSISSFLYTIVYWFYNVNIITTERIVDVNFNGITSYNVSEAQIEKIEDVSVDNIGIWASVFNFGTVMVQTAAEKTRFEFPSVAEPGKVQDILRDIMELKQRGVRIT